MKKILIPLLLVQLSCAVAQPLKHRYKESTEVFPNPERGFYIPTGTRASDYKLLDAEMLQSYLKPQQLKGAKYQVQFSLVYRGYELDAFVDKPLSTAFLENLQKDFDAIRNAGLKLILRFAYTNNPKAGNCPDEYKICPPYGDASKEVVFNHIRQLAPLLKKNADVIAVMQEGFIGIWGESYFTDHFGDASTNGLGVVADSSWNDRNQLLKNLLTALPADRMVQVRTPQIRQRFVYGPRARVNAAPMALKDAFSKTDLARVALHNDCFLASADDYGTFYDYGNSGSKRDTANYQLRKYFEAESRFLAVGGETCDDAFSPQNDCAPAGFAEQEMASMHYSYLNASYNKDVLNDWDSAGCMKSIQQKLGYRLVLKEAALPRSLKAGEGFAVQLTIKNVGYASPFNPRPVQLVLRNATTGKVILLPFTTSIQKWFAGETIQLRQKFSLPANAAPGRYEMLLNLPDGYQNLQSNPAYSIRLANEDVWEPGTGFNKLRHNISVR